ncbi:uracil-DNA glycosylase family protein [Weissella tructae]|uniref:Uracil DNA glycosylase n=2 Tax=Weissella TaxID=46255 RepID=A0A075TWZ6_9LACO|nr:MULTISPECIES: uracil-DNA glycosylase family protein [Weissella]AIG66099.1 Uracil DNA glycosylase [Weissella tructae]AIM63479.1 Uracil DNA glycosylase [Weissella ceti]AIM64814.1 Uracil DNA glycosylase [Weissella ceti]ELA07472.1 uracil DNA glycosylase [Weissella ceti NC36]QVV91249.1 uracil-DNA glycosylase family protein [Weissella tructae]
MTIRDEIASAPENQIFTEKGWKPLFAIPKTAKILIIGQAPGLKTQEQNVMWRDASGDRLRSWLGIDDAIFYDSGDIAVLPMDFYFPGKGKSGDLPPRKIVAEKWHPKMLQMMPNIKLTILIGAYAQHYYLDEKASVKITDNVRQYKDFLPTYFPLVHPSPRNNIWLSQNPWFETDVIPALQTEVQRVLQTDK